MTSKVKAIPEGRGGAIPYLCVHDAAEALEFYVAAFGATELMRFEMPGGAIGHAEIAIGDALVMLADEHPDLEFRSPRALGGSPVTVHLYVEDVDAFVERAVAAGATLTRPVEDQFYGDRSGQLVDPFGHVWHVATHVEDVGLDEMQARAAARFGDG